MNYTFIIIIIILLLIFSYQNKKEKLDSLVNNYDHDLLYTYEKIFYPNYIKTYYKNNNFLELSQKKLKICTKNCQDCNSLDKTNCGLCFDCGWCIDKNGIGKCVSGGIQGPNNYLDRKICNIYRHPSLFKRFNGPFTGRKI